MSLTGTQLIAAGNLSAAICSYMEYRHVGKMLFHGWLGWIYLLGLYLN